MIISSIYHNIYWNKFNIFFLNIFLEINIYHDVILIIQIPDVIVEIQFHQLDR